MNDKLILYVGEKNISSWSMRGFLALEVKGLSYEERSISLIEDKDRSRRRKVSPTGRVPVLHAGDLLIPDSLAFVEFLEEAYPPPVHPALWPRDRAARAHARWLAAAMHSGFAKLRESMSFNLCFLPRRPAPSPEALQEADEMLSYWEDALARKEQALAHRGGTGDPSSPPTAGDALRSAIRWCRSRPGGLRHESQRRQRARDRVRGQLVSRGRSVYVPLEANTALSTKARA